MHKNSKEKNARKALLIVQSQVLPHDASQTLWHQLVARFCYKNHRKYVISESGKPLLPEGQHPAPVILIVQKDRLDKNKNKTKLTNPIVISDHQIDPEKS